MWGRTIALTVLLAGIVTGAGACGSEPTVAETKPVTPSPTAASPSATTAAPPTLLSSADQKVCGAPDGLETHGQPFSTTYVYVLQNNGQGPELTVSELTDQVRALTTIGAPAGLNDGSTVIGAASFDVRQAITHLVKDAEDWAPEVVNGEASGGSGFTDIVYSMTEAIGACKTAGYLVSWMGRFTPAG